MQGTLISLHENIRSGAIDPRDALDTALAAARTRGAELNCVVEVTADLAWAELNALEADKTAPRGLLWGVPLAHKDMFDRADALCEWGASITAGQQSGATATVLSRLAAAGSVNIARLHMAEFAMGLSGHNDHLGRCLNPHDPTRITGGSSSGSAAAVAAGIVTAALGSDTGGSIRVPAGLCGVVGLKPTHGMVPMDGVMPLAPSLDCVGPIARSVTDAARVFDVILGLAVTDPGPHERALWDLPGVCSVALPARFFWDDLTPSVAAALDGWRRAMEAARWRFLEVQLDDPGVLGALNMTVLGHEAAATHRERLATQRHMFGRQVLARLEAGERVTQAEYDAAIAARPGHLRRFVDQALGAADVVALPVLRCETFRGEQGGGEDAATIARVLGEIGHTMRPISYLGLPALALPVGRDGNGMPVAIQLVGRPGSEARLLQAGLAVEREMGF